MANEITSTIGLTLVNGNLRVSFPQVARQYTQTTSGLSDQVLSIGTSEENVSFGDVSTPGILVLHNLDSTNYVEYGQSDGGTMKKLGKLAAGDVHTFRLAGSVTLRMQANTAACKVRVMCLET
jgi:hypothetical protein